MRLFRSMIPVLMVAAWGATSSNAAYAANEVVLTINYQIKCDGSDHKISIPGEIENDSRTIRFDLVENGAPVRLILTDASEEQAVKIHTEEAPGCSLLSYEEEKESIGDDLVKIHSPYLVVREDQYANRQTDVPIGVVHSTKTDASGNTIILYTVFFTDEDSEPDASDTSGQMSRYGRRADVEWLYEVTVNPEGRAIKRRFQTGMIGGVGHADEAFTGTFLPGTQHPILYDIATHNVFDQNPDGPNQKAKLVGYHFAAIDGISKPEARERWMMKNPWTFAMSDAELKREHKLAAESDQYLYLVMRGQMSLGGVSFQLLSPSGKKLSQTVGSDFDRFGEDLWGKEGISAIPLPAGGLEALRSGGSIVLETTFGYMPIVKMKVVDAIVLQKTENGLAPRSRMSELSCTPLEFHKFQGKKTLCQFR